MNAPIRREFILLWLFSTWFWVEARANEFQIAIDTTAHRTYGLFYPVTYVFRIPAGQSDLSAQYRYDRDRDWIPLPVRTAADFFNGVAAARFDYAEGLTYLSIPFSSGADSIYLRVTRGERVIDVNYLGIAAYYDNRRAAVTVSLDDWDTKWGSYFSDACVILNNAHLFYTVAVVTHGNPNWDSIQGWYDSGYMEPASHTRDHSCSQVEYAARGYIDQIRGSRDDILSCLKLREPYVTTFIEPCGYTDAQVREQIIAAGYLTDRGYPTPPVQNDFSPWSPDGAYGRSLYSFDTSAWQSGENQDLLAKANAAFDRALSSGGIYHLMDHPWYGLWRLGSFLQRHITYIANRKDVWYATFGGLYLYHFVPDRGLLKVYESGSATPLESSVFSNSK